MSRGRSAEYYYKSRELEEAIVDTFDYLVEDAYRRRNISGELADAVMRVVKDNLGAYADKVVDRYRSDYITQDEINSWCGRAIDPLCDQVLEMLDRLDRERNRGRGRGYDRSDRDRYRDDDRDPRRSNRSNKFRNRSDDGNDAGIGWGNAKRTKPEESEDERRSRLASESSKRLREQERRDGVNQPRLNQPVNNDADQRMSYDLPGTTMTENYAVVANIKPDAAPLALAVSPVDKANIQQPVANDLYKIEHKNNYSIGAVMAVQSLNLRIFTPFEDISNALDMLIHDDPVLFNAENFCHLVTFNRVSVYNTEGFGEAMLSVMPKLHTLFKDAQMTIQQRMLNFSIILNEVPNWVRNAYMARIIRKWNAVARCNFALPGNPSDYLAVASWEQLQSLFPDAAPVDPALSEKVNALTASKGLNAYVVKLANSLNWIFRTSLLGRNGYIDVANPEHLGYLSQFDELPFVIDRRFRARDLWRMNDEQRGKLAAQFSKDWYCSIEQIPAIVTNLKVHDLLPHPKVNCISADDAPAACLIKELIKQVDGYHHVYTCDKHANARYACHAGSLISDDLQLVSLSPNM